MTTILDNILEAKKSQIEQMLLQPISNLEVLKQDHPYLIHFIKLKDYK